MITHYGLFWSERDVYWGKGGLVGVEKPPPLGRRGAPKLSERGSEKSYGDLVGLYSLYGNGELLYVGKTEANKTSSLLKRLGEHRKDSMAGRWDSFSWFGCERYADNRTGKVKVFFSQLEAVAIAITNPGLNKQSGAFSGAKQVFQVPHENSEGDIDTKLSRILELVEGFAATDDKQSDKQ